MWAVLLQEGLTTAGPEQISDVVTCWSVLAGQYLLVSTCWSVEPRAPVGLPRHTLLLALDRGSLLALALLRRLLVELATTEFSEDARFFAGPLETPEGGVKMLVFSYSYAGQGPVPQVNGPMLNPGSARSGTGQSGLAGEISRLFRPDEPENIASRPDICKVRVSI